MKYTCPCCGYRTLENEPPGTYIICPICFWEDDGIQFDDPDYEGGANKVSLRQAQKNFIEFGAFDSSALAYVRSPSVNDERNVEWKSLSS